MAAWRSVLWMTIALALSAAELLGQLQSEGVIYNRGTIVIKGNARVRQDTLGGTVVFAWDRDGVNQYIPHKVYEDVRFTGRTQKMLLDTTRPLVALRRFETDSGTVFRQLQRALILSCGETVHRGIINPAHLYGRIVLQGQQAQDLWGRGLFRELELDNPAGANVRRGGGFTVSTVLELKRGLLRNSAADNFRLADSATIVRTAEGELAAAPIFGRDIAVRYVGRGRIFSGPELPHDSLSLRALYVENDSGVVLQSSVTVNDSLVLQAPLWTELDTAHRYVLTYTAERKDPVFLHPDAEIIGTIRRTRLRTDGEPVVFNNPYTYVRTDQGWGSVAQVQIRVLPQTQPWHPQSQQKVWRVLQITAQDAAGQTVSQGLNWRVGYGWRHLPGDPNRDETRGLPLPALILHRWTRDGWFAAGRSVPPQLDTAASWAYAYADGVYGGGDFAIGLRDNARNLRLQVAAILEGPYRNGSMVDDLRQRGWLPETPPDIYPYNLDPMRPYIRVSPLPDSVVDWVVVELRTLLTGGARYYRTAFVRRDGRVVDLDGKSPITLPGIESGAYYVAIHHRNHLAIITAEPVEIAPETQQQVLAMTEDPSRILGGAGALRALRYNGRTVWAMISGDVNGDGRVDAEDLQLLQLWQHAEGYVNADTDLSGIVTTRDFNVGWNNRDRNTVVVR
ncbi:MAG: hypothetical protein NZ960_07135 [Candidatus Kapabacteria bacterium]|nr:hypothetical protein [Candidatus Kapabacteria bacterium]MDW8012946.1 hypothetical protein [Bacteroidota bacterium]